MKNLVSVLVLFVGISLLAACGEEVSFHTQEQNRNIAIDNANYNMKAFRRTSIEYDDWAIKMAGDSTISHKCAQGDGWASLELINRADHKKRVKVKCSTVSSSKGCMLQTEFNGKSYADEDGVCNTKLPNPLPKILN